MCRLLSPQALPILETENNDDSKNDSKSDAKKSTRNSSSGSYEATSGTSGIEFERAGRGVRRNQSQKISEYSRTNYRHALNSDLPQITGTSPLEGLTIESE